MRRTGCPEILRFPMVCGRRAARWLSLLAGVTVLAWSPGAFARAVLDGRGEPLEAAAGLSRAAELVIVIDDADDLRRGVSGRAAIELFARSAGAIEPLERAWRDLAQQLALDDDRAFDELLGRRVAILVDGLEEPEPRWAIIALVPGATKHRVITRLNATPRRMSQQVQVLGLEGGRLELAVLPGDARDGTRQIVLAPRGADLIDRLIALEREPVRPLDDAGMRTLAGRHDVAVVVRSVDPATPPLLATARALDGADWSISVVGPRGLLPSPIRDGRADPVAWSLLEPRPLLVWSSSSAFVPGVLGRVLSQGGLLDRLRETPERERFTTIVLDGAGEQAAVSVLIRSEAFGELIADADATLGSALRVSAGVPGPDFGGRFPTAIRAVSMTAADPRQRERTGVEIVWSFRGRGDAGGGLAPMPAGGIASDGGVRARAGWCLITSGPAGETTRRAQRAGLRAIERAEPADESERLFTLHARPSRLVAQTSLLSPGVTDSSVVARLLAGIEEVSLVATPMGADRFRVDAKVTLSGGGSPPGFIRAGSSRRDR